MNKKNLRRCISFMNVDIDPSRFSLCQWFIMKKGEDTAIKQRRIFKHFENSDIIPKKMTACAGGWMAISYKFPEIAIHYKDMDNVGIANTSNGYTNFEALQSFFSFDNPDTTLLLFSQDSPLYPNGGQLYEVINRLEEILETGEDEFLINNGYYEDE